MRTQRGRAALREQRATRSCRRLRAAARLLPMAGLALGLGLGAALGPRLALAAVARLQPEALSLRELRVHGAARLEVGEIAATAELEPGSRLDAVDAGAVVARLAAHPWIAAARVVALPPHRLAVAVREHEPVATATLEPTPVTSEGLGEPAQAAHWWVDRAGVAFAPVEAQETPALPQLRGSGATPETPDALLAAGVELLSRLDARGLPPARSIQLGGAPPERLPALELASLPGRVLLGAGELDARLERLADLLAAELPEVQRASEIDLRFGGRAVLRSDPAPDGSREAATRGGAEPPG